MLKAGKRRFSLTAWWDLTLALTRSINPWMPATSSTESLRAQSTHPLALLGIPLLWQMSQLLYGSAAFQPPIGAGHYGLLLHHKGTKSASCHLCPGLYMANRADVPLPQAPLHLKSRQRPLVSSPHSHLSSPHLPLRAKSRRFSLFIRCLSDKILEGIRRQDASYSHYYLARFCKYKTL